MFSLQLPHCLYCTGWCALGRIYPPNPSIVFVVRRGQWIDHRCCEPMSLPCVTAQRWWSRQYDADVFHTCGIVGTHGPSSKRIEQQSGNGFEPGTSKEMCHLLFLIYVGHLLFFPVHTTTPPIDHLRACL